MTSVLDLVRAWELPAATSAPLEALLTLLDADPTAPTTVRDPAAATDAHLADSLVALELPVVRAARTLADLGAGAGFPGLPLAIALPRAHVSLVESVARKCAFLGRATAGAGIANASVVNDRAETWEAGREANDVVTARALAPLAVLAEYAAPLLVEGGALVAWKGRRDAGEERAGAAAAAELGLEPAEPLRVQPFPAAGERHLHVFTKVAPTPPRYPRRPGMARKRPLGA
jgi:16S rRNA (guanine527-N7)-methyltransferase